MMKNKCIALFIALWWGAVNIAYAGNGFFTEYVDILSRAVPQNQEVSLHDASNQDLVLTNNSAIAVTVHVQALVPTSGQLKANAKAIPSLSWMRIEPSTFRIAPHSQGSCKIIVHVPPERRYRNHYYQVMIWSRARQDGASETAITAGLLSCVRFMPVQFPLE